MFVNLNDKNLIYRYRAPTEYALSELLLDSFVLSSADTLNDEHDISIGFDLNKAYRLLLNNDLFIRKLAEITKKDKSFEERYAELKNGIKGRALISLSINTLFVNYIKIIKRCLLLGCFTSEYSNSTMWAHYAKNGSGFVLGYDINLLKESLLKNNQSPVEEIIYDVDYKNETYDITDNLLNSLQKHLNSGNLYNVIDNEFFNSLDNNVLTYFHTKQKQWSYEKEKRIIVYNNTQLGDMHKEILKMKPSVVIIGKNTSLPTRYFIASVCKAKDIPLYVVESSFSCGKYSLEPRFLLPEEINSMLNNFSDFINFNGAL